MTTRDRLSAEAARQIAERGYHGTSIGSLAKALGIQKSSVYSYIDNKEDLLIELASVGAAHFHEALDSVPEDVEPLDRLRLGLHAHLHVVHTQLDVATIWLKEWRFLTGQPRKDFLRSRRRYEQRIRGLFEDATRSGSLPEALDLDHAVLLFFSVGNWAYTWMSKNTDVDAEADAFWALMQDGLVRP
ncbi:MAG: TetR family transcriptional regulator [Actinobacteria bacterium]|nr:TetR family transcriptional regulator [Actinomycetota bacterium]